MRYLTLKLDGEMQYYASTSTCVHSSSGVYYKTEKCPTRTALVGMIGACLGYKREDERLNILSRLSYRYKTVKKGSILTDFQTVKPLLKGQLFSKVDGTTGTSAVIKTIEYLQDYSFEVYVGADEETLKQIYGAFKNPVFPPHLGKRSCFPSGPMVTDFILKDLEDLEHVYDCP